MGQPNVARVDVAALHAVARQYEVAADIVEGAVRTHLSGSEFDGAAAGRVHPPIVTPRQTPAPPGEWAMAEKFDVTSRLAEGRHAVDNIAAAAWQGGSADLSREFLRRRRPSPPRRPALRPPPKHRVRSLPTNYRRWGSDPRIANPSRIADSEIAP